MNRKVNMHGAKSTGILPCLRKCDSVCKAASKDSIDVED
jgi:hypothetical protein